jgi:hypothetical protein
MRRSLAGPGTNKEKPSGTDPGNYEFSMSNFYQENLFLIIIPITLGTEVVDPLLDLVQMCIMYQLRIQGNLCLVPILRHTKDQVQP